MWLRLSPLALVVAVGCGNDPCDPNANTGCDSHQTCEQPQGGDAKCVPALEVVGRVFDLDTNAGIAGARIVALDANGAAASFVATSGSDGSYALQLPVERNSAGAPATTFTVTLRADAAGYVTFPAGIRPALPMDTATATMTGGHYEIKSSLTDIGLLKLPAGTPAGGTIKGNVAENATHASALVVAEVNGVGYTSIAARDGDYTIFNVPAGSVNVNAYARGYNYTAKSADVKAGASTTVDLDLSSDAASTVSGSVNIVNGGNGTMTSVILVLESTFNTMLARGETPPGLRAPDPGTAPNVTNAFSISGVPAGKYVVLAGFENDFLVRDESSIGGTSIVHQEVVAGQDVAIGTSFKLTGADDIVSPGANGPEMVTGTPTFKWVDDSSEDRYTVTVFDSYGTDIWDGGTPKSVVTLTYGGPPLKSGQYYQFRVASIKDPSEVISRSEDLKGVFLEQ